VLEVLGEGKLVELPILPVDRDCLQVLQRGGVLGLPDIEFLHFLYQRFGVLVLLDFRVQVRLVELRGFDDDFLLLVLGINGPIER
jgi:hypothetical protein